MTDQVFEQPAGTSQTEASQLLNNFWPRKMQEIRAMTDFKTQELPLARIKKIMKQDEEVKMISAEAPVLFAKAAEIFINELSLRAWVHTEDNKRRTLQRNDIAMAITKYDMFDFLIDIVPRDELKPNKRQQDTMRHTMMAPQDQVQYYFQLAHQYQQQQPQNVQSGQTQQIQVANQQQQPSLLGGIAQPQQGTVVVTMASAQPQLIQTQTQEQSDVGYPAIHLGPPQMQYINRMQQLQQIQQQQQIQGVTATTQGQVIQTQPTAVQAQPAVPVTEPQPPQSGQQNPTQTAGTPQTHTEFASYGGQIYQIQTATPGGTPQVYLTTQPGQADPQQQVTSQAQQSSQQSQNGESDLSSQSSDQQT